MKRIAWITVPAFISTDIFIIPELSKYYVIDWYLIAKQNEKIDFADNIDGICKRHGFKCVIKIIKTRNSSIKTALEYKRILCSIKQKKYDLIYSVMIGIPYYMLLLKIIIGNRKTLVAIHNVHVPKGGSAYFPSVLYTKFTIKSFKYFQTFSVSQKKELLKIAPKKYCDNVNFVLMDYGQATIERDNNRITLLSFGIIRDYKRIDVLIRAAENAYAKTGIKFRVIIAGACNDWNKYQTLIQHPDLFDLKIRRIEDCEVPNLFGESHYFVAPYQDIAQSGSAIIAVNYNIPIIASRLEAFETYVEDEVTGFLINPADVDDLTRVFIKILKNHSCFYDDMCGQIAEMKEKQFSTSGVAKLYVRNFDYVMECQ